MTTNKKKAIWIDSELHFKLKVKAYTEARFLNRMVEKHLKKLINIPKEKTKQITLEDLNE